MRDNGWSWMCNHWDLHKEDTCYRPSFNQFSSMKYYKDKRYTIYPATDFIKNNNMTQLTIEIPNGHEIDIENSDLSKGVVKFKPIKPTLPTKWEDIEDVTGYYVDPYSCVYYHGGLPLHAIKNVWPTKELAKASLALCQLVRLRDIYNEGWQPDWTDNQNKYVIEFFKGKKEYYTYLRTQCVLAFKDSKTRDLFLETFKDLIEEAKPLL